MIDTIADLVQSIIRWLFRAPINFIRRNIKAVLAAYLLGVGPLAYLSTASTTQFKLTDAKNITNYLQATVKDQPFAGTANLLTGGLSYPLINSGKKIVGSMKTFTGDIFNSKKMIANGTNLKNQADAWFEAGKGASDVIKTKSGEIIISDIDVPTDKLKNVSFNYLKYPDYYRVIGLANVNKAQFPEKGVIKYGKLDQYGRTTTAIGTLSYSNFKNSLGVRQKFTAKDAPSGWGNNDIVSIPGKNGRTYNGYMWNRSHLIGDAIGGDATKVNVITGTRPQNVGNVDLKGGMRYLEIKTENYFKDHPNTKNVVYYKAQPVYKGKELVPRSVIVTAMSSDKKINEKVEVFNTANKYTINYNNGTYKPAK